MNDEAQPGAGPGPSDQSAAPAPEVSPAPTPPGGPPGPGVMDDGLVHEELTEPEPIDYDRWAHRRAEPRPLAFMWTVYLFTATAMTFAAISGVGGLTLDVYRPALKVLLMSAAAGVVVVWPMIRLSQTGPYDHPASASVKDLFAVIVPLQAIIWPQWLLASWPVSVIAGLAGTLTAWGVLTAGILALYFRWEAARGRPGSRAGMMLVFVLLVGLGPLAGAAWMLVGSAGPDGPSRATWWMLSSPLTAVFEITTERADGAGAARGVPAHWAAAVNVAVVGLVCWFWSVAAGRRGVAGVTSGPTNA